MGQFVCQWFMVLSLVFSLFSMIKRDIEGTPARPPKGFEGVVCTIVGITITAFIYYFAGSFSLVLP
jgi:hypothetical protein